MKLGRQGQLEEAKQSLAWLRGGEHCKEEEVEIIEVCTAALPFFTENFSLNCVGKDFITLFTDNFPLRCAQAKLTPMWARWRV